MLAIRPVIKQAVRSLLRDPGAPGPVFPPGYGRSWFQAAGEAVRDRGLFVGCPLELFELTARDPFCVALMEGLRPGSSVLEVGCGCLRVGYWFVSYLDAGNYCGIEPNTPMLDAGRELILGPLEREKRPRFDANDRFDLTVFDTTFDLVIAYSIWTHASKPQIETMLDGFNRTANPGARFVASWIEPHPGMPDYQGTAWVGRSHDSDRPGCVAHARGWLEDAAASRGLKVRFLDTFTTITQQWLVVTRPG